MEQWKKIYGYDNYYVSDMGNVKTTDYNHTGKERTLKIFANQYGYMAVNLMQGGKRKRFLVHRLVAQAFHSLSEFIGATVNHKDGNKKNNSHLNLEWCTASDNLKHAHKNGMVKYSSGESHYMSKLPSESIIEIRKHLSKGVKGRTLADVFGVSEKYISSIKVGRSRKHEQIN